MHAVISTEIPYEADGLDMAGYLARPSREGHWPVVLIGHDGIGLDNYQRGRADQLAAHGYIAFAMDFHGGQTFFGMPEAMLARTMPLLADTARMRSIGGIALNALRAKLDVEIGELFAIGYGAGGHIVLELAQTGVSFEAIALVHPSLPKSGAHNWHNMNTKALLCTGSEDPICTPHQLLAFGQTLQDAGADWRVNIYGGAKHAFWSRPAGADGLPTGGLTHVQATVPGIGYHPEHAERCWRAILDLFGEYRGAPPSSLLPR